MQLLELFLLQALYYLLNKILKDYFVRNIDSPRQITEGRDGYVFVGSKQGKVYALKDHDNNGEIDDIQIILDGLNDSSGVAYKNGSLYVAEIDKVWRIDNIEENLDTFSEKSLSKILVTDDLPSDQWHGRKWIMVDDDGSIFLNIGAPCNVCLNDDERYATIVKLKDEKWTIEARGVRNSVGFDVNPINNKLYFTDNGRDWMGDSIPSCELNVLEESGDFFGFPYLHSSDVIDPEYGDGQHGFEIKKPILELGAYSHSCCYLVQRWLEESSKRLTEIKFGSLEIPFHPYLASVN